MALVSGCVLAPTPNNSVPLTATVGAMADLSRLVEGMRPFSTSIFGTMSARATELNAINLGQGFPDTDGPDELKAIAATAIADGSGNQYPPAHGLPDLRLAVAEHQQRFYDLTVDPATDVVVTTGASEALAAAVIGLVSPGDEVIIFEPYFDLYPAIVAMAGATPVYVPLHTPAPGSGHGFSLDIHALRQAITAHTRMILVNSPHNPTGMVFSHLELREVADLAIVNDLIVLSDEAYEHLTFDGVAHIPIATLSGMFERTVTVGSGGKCFSFTGWKVGWASGPTDLITAVRVVRQHLSFVSGGPFQPAIAAGLRLPDSYFEELARGLAAKRDLLGAGLREIGFEVLPTKGTYFITTDIRPLGVTDGIEFCRDLVERVGVAAIPHAELAVDRQVFQPYIRWTFCKQPSVLNAALGRLRLLA